MRVLQVLAILVFAASLTVHLCTFFTDFLDMRHGLWLFHLLTLAVFILTIILANRSSRSDRRAQGESMRKMLAPIPGWMRIVFALAFAYAILNFVLFLFLSGGGAPSIKDGQYVVSDHGRVIRTLTESEYRKALAIETRGFSGHWMLFSWAAVAMGTCVLRLRKMDTSCSS